ncbi:DNA topoisomerase [Paraphysoderma sedebokerense]|nr:DNA topoisomerase [Paraphysoderma sedebokerense]
MKILCVAEKPSLAKTISNLLSCGSARSRNGRNKYCKNYDFIYKLNGQEYNVTMTSLLGHLMCSNFADGYNKNWNAHDPEVLFDAPITKFVNPKMQDIKQNLQNEVRSASMLVIWTDCDREGENIGSEVVQVCTQVNRNVRVLRARFSVIQAREIQRAMNNLAQLDTRQSDAVDARIELDLRIGAAFTRFQTLKLGKRYADLKDKIISYGSCQFPTLGFVVDQYLKVENFVAEDFWKIEVTVNREGKTCQFSWNRGRLFDQHFCLVLYERCVEEPMAKVKDVKTKNTSKWRPLPLTTVELQKIGSRSLRISSDMIMTIAEKLYNSGLISYPRTETDQFEDNFELRPLIQKQIDDPQWGQYAQGLLNGSFRKPRKGKNNDKAHPPIHPTNKATHLSGNERKVYELVTRRFLAACSDDARGFETSVEIEIAGEEFGTKGLIVTERNYLEVYPYERWNANEIPQFHVNEEFLPDSCEMIQGRTSPPSLLSEADLIGLMDKSGIGTDATIHEHIKKIIERQYVFKENNFFTPSNLGIALVEGYDAIGLDVSLAKPFLRAEMESDMRLICDGQRTREQVVEQSKNKYREVFRKSSAEVIKLEEALTKYFGYGPQDLVDEVCYGAILLLIVLYFLYSLGILSSTLDIAVVIYGY